MEFDIRNLDTRASEYDVTKAIASVLHVCPGPFVTDQEQRPPNFDVKLHESECVGFSNKGTGEISVVVNNRRLKFYSNSNPVRNDLALKLEKAPFIDPDIEWELLKTLNALDDSFVVAKVQIGLHAFHYVIYTNVEQELGSQREDVYRPENKNFETGYRHRVGSLHPGHAAVAPYAHHLRIVLFNDSSYYGGDVLDKFYEFCRIAGLQRPIRDVRIDASGLKFFDHGKLLRVSKWLKELNTNWRVAFQIEALLRNGIANTIEVLELRPRVDDLIRRHGKSAAQIMRYFVEAAANRPRAQPLEKCYEAVLQRKLRRPRLATQGGRFFCHHVTFTPTRLFLEGPNVMQSNRVIRNFEGYEDFFLRVDFRDEDRLQYRWDRDVDGVSYLQERVGKVLKEGFDLAGRHFDFLAYSQSALRSHAVWYVSSFHHPEKGLVTADKIRGDIGTFDEVIFSPSKYGARMAQAFTATDSSVRIHKSQWRPDMPDIKENGILFTDGVGTISQELSNMIWDALCYKGMVSVDTRLEGIRMCLRPSMKKFSVPETDYADIEIADAFGRPRVPHLNRPLIMVLEDRGAPKEAFLELQEEEVSKTRRAHDSVELFAGLELKPNLLQRPLDTPFLAQLRSCAINHVLRDIKYRARIPIPDSYMLVGVADEGPAYEKEGHKNNPGDKEPNWIKGMCLVSRSPVIHPGDIQRVYAIGKPPEDQICLFGHLRNVVVFSSIGTRSLPNSLGGGDLDGDQYEVIQYGPFLVPEHHDPASYPTVSPFRLDRESTIEDVCDFIVEYINSDVVGLVSDKHITIADQSNYGVLDPACLKLAEMHSKAVDYPKNGNKVDLSRMPRQLIPFKPDWHQIEQPTHHRVVGYYESSRALGHMYRNITLEEIPDNPSDVEQVLSDPITKTLQTHVRRQLRGQQQRADQGWIDPIYMGYREELTYISTTYSFSRTPLREEELVVGVILANCSDGRYKRDRQYAMRESLSFLVHGTRLGIVGEVNETTSDEELKQNLARSWDAWTYSLQKAVNQSPSERFGSRSFGLIALGLVLDCLVKLNGLPPLFG
ncbi:hypothetical protein ID866_7441 [Astraeus odoratus]|nr:hypothetical protein ID866_7441 [Astraeus odoratus]